MDLPLKLIISFAIAMIAIAIIGFMVQNQLGGAEETIIGILGFK